MDRNRLLPCLLTLLIAALSIPVPEASAQLLDDFETLQGWQGTNTHGDAVKVRLGQGEGRTGKALVMDFAFVGFMGAAWATKEVDLTLPENFEFSFDIRAEAPINDFEFRLLDSAENVWWLRRIDFVYPSSWTTMRVKKRHFVYAWGPGGRHDVRWVKKLIFVVSTGSGGKGRVWIDNLRLQRLDDQSITTVHLATRVSSALPGGSPRVLEGTLGIGGWTCRDGHQRIDLDLRRPTDIGGMFLDWDSLRFPTAFEVSLSPDGRQWTKAYIASRANGLRTPVYLGDREARFMRLDLLTSNRGRGYALDRLVVQGPEFGFSPNDFFRALAAEAPRGSYPRHMVPEQSYWTVVGASGDRKEALMNEQGMIETDKKSFSLEPFLFADGRLVTWADVTTTPSLERDDLPIPSVQWLLPGRITLTTMAVAAGSEGRSHLLVRYRATNIGDTSLRGSLFVAIRPFQVNPPWQTFTVVGGVARIDSIRCAAVLSVNDRQVFPLTPPEAMGAAEFDRGDVTRYLRAGTVPPWKEAIDHVGYASAALQYRLDLDPGASRDVVVAVPFHADTSGLAPRHDDRSAGAFFERSRTETAAFWAAKVDRFDITLPPSAQAIVRTIKSNLAYIAINADSAGMQPGSRSYERSWIRDGSLICSALLYLGMNEEVRRYIDWYARYQFPNGMIPCIVDSRGADPVEEHDSHGQFIYLVAQYFRFTRDTTWLRSVWPTVVRTVRYIQGLRAERKTDPYQTGTQVQRAMFGLVPASISHEGYSAKPQHAYWDDFFILRGLKDAAYLAGVIGDPLLVQDFATERDDFRACLMASIRASMTLHDIDYIPGCVEQRGFDGTSTTVGVNPGGELGVLPEPALHRTFDMLYEEIMDRYTGSGQWTSYVPYQIRLAGVCVFLRQRERAHELLRVLMGDRRPAAWNHWAEIVWKGALAPSHIGDMPHTWAAADFLRSVRSMFVYERDADEALVLAAGVPLAWIDDPVGVTARALPTYYGRIGYSLRREGNLLVVEVSGEGEIPPGGVVVQPPLKKASPVVRGDGHWNPVTREVVIDHFPARVVVEE